MNKNKILISGATSRTANALLEVLISETNDEIVLLSNSDINLYFNKRIKFYKTNVAQINTLKKICYDEAPNAIVITNGIHDISLCETNKKLAWTVNVTIVENFLTISRVLDAHLIMISTDQIFDGRKGPYTEEDKPNPQNYFGKTKHTAENALLANLLKSTIIRTSMIYGTAFSPKNDFINDIIAEFNAKSQILINEGNYTNPTFVDDIALAIYKIIIKQRFGIYNVAGSDILNNFDIYIQISEAFNLNEGKLRLNQNKPKSISQRLNNRYGLITLKAETDLGIKLTSFQNGLIARRFKSFSKNNIYGV